MLKFNQSIIFVILTYVILISFPFTITESNESHAATDAKAELFRNLVIAENEQEGRIAEDAIWRFWLDQSPTEKVRSLIDTGMQRRKAYDYDAALDNFNKVIELAPDYAEGYNQRAFILFLKDQYALAEADLEVVLQLEPLHFGAYAGMFHVMRKQHRLEAALKMLKSAVTIHPWIQERFALPEVMWPDRYRELRSKKQEI